MIGKKESRFSIVIPVSGVLVIDVITTSHELAVAEAQSRFTESIQSIKGGQMLSQNTAVLPIEHKLPANRIVSV